MGASDHRRLFCLHPGGAGRSSRSHFIRQVDGLHPAGDGRMWGVAPRIGPGEIPPVWDPPENLASLDAHPAPCPVEPSVAQATQLRRRIT